MIPEAVKKLHELFKKENKELYLVGGCVRDKVMGIQPHDYDMCTNAMPEETLDIMHKYGISYITKGLAFGTVVALIDNVEYEITTYREDMMYSDGRHPDEVSFVRDIRTDLGRRDFTINAMAMDIETEAIIDPYHGTEDIVQKRIRCVREPSERFEEDALRVLRAIRFAVKLGFTLEDKTKEAMHENVSGLERVSKERITDEFRKMFTCNKPITPIFTEFSDVITFLIPCLKATVGFNQNNKYHKHNVYEHLLAVYDLADTNKFEIKMSALLHDVGKPQAYTVDENGQGHFYGHPAISREICEKELKEDLRLTKKETDLILELIESHDEYIANTKKSVKKFIAKHGKEFLDDWYILKEADFNDHIFPEQHKPDNWFTDIKFVKELEKELEQEENCLKITNLAVTGEDVMNFYNIKPSKRVGEVLNILFEKVLNDEVQNTKEDLLAVMKGL